MYSTILSSEQARNYMNAAKEYIQYVMNGGNSESTGVVRRYKFMLQQYTDYLDGLGLYMPQPRFKFNVHDKSTWRYIDCTVNHGKYIRGIVNPHWKYLTKTYQGEDL